MAMNLPSTSQPLVRGEAPLVNLTDLRLGKSATPAPGPAVDGSALQRSFRTRWLRDSIELEFIDHADKSDPLNQVHICTAWDTVSGLKISLQHATFRQLQNDLERWVKVVVQPARMAIANKMAGTPIRAEVIVNELVDRTNERLTDG